MSWSVQIVGRASAVAKALEERGASMSGQSKVEYDDAKPHLVGLVQQNFQRGQDPVVKLEASGSGGADEQGQRDRSCSVKLEVLYGFVGA